MHEESSKQSSRLVSIDIVRGLAIALMIMVHSMLYLSGAMPDYDGTFVYYVRSHNIFIPVSGMSMYFWFRSSRANVTTTIVIRRSLFLFLLGIVLLIVWWDMRTALDWDVLSLIGAMTACLWFTRHLPPRYHLIIGIGIILSSPLLQHVADYQRYWSRGTYISIIEVEHAVKGFLVNGYFPLFPFLGAGYLGFWFAGKLEAGQVTLLAKITCAMVIAGSILLLHPFFIGQSIRQLQYTYYPTTIPVLLLAVGITFSLALILGAIYDQRNTRPGLVSHSFQQFGRHALFAYIAHFSVLFLGMKLYIYLSEYHQYKFDIPLIWEHFFLNAVQDGALLGTVYRAMPITSAIAAGLLLVIVLMGWCLLHDSWRHRNHGQQPFSSNYKH